jgi:Kef-type K+ transport system membrane component KefB
MILLTFILACYGATMIAVYGKIFDAIRPQYHFFRCPMCMGFWIGVLNAMCFFELPFNTFIAGCISSGTSYFISRLVDDDGILINIKTNKK